MIQGGKTCADSRPAQLPFHFESSLKRLHSPEPSSDEESGEESDHVRIDIAFSSEEDSSSDDQDTLKQARHQRSDFSDQPIEIEEEPVNADRSNQIQLDAEKPLNGLIFRKFSNGVSRTSDKADLCCNLNKENRELREPSRRTRKKRRLSDIEPCPTRSKSPVPSCSAVFSCSPNVSPNNTFVQAQSTNEIPASKVYRQKSSSRTSGSSSSQTQRQAEHTFNSINSHCDKLSNFVLPPATVYLKELPDFTVGVGAKRSVDFEAEKGEGTKTVSEGSLSGPEDGIYLNQSPGHCSSVSWSKSEDEASRFESIVSALSAGGKGAGIPRGTGSIQRRELHDLMMVTINMNETFKVQRAKAVRASQVPGRGFIEASSTRVGEEYQILERSIPHCNARFVRDKPTGKCNNNSVWRPSMASARLSEVELENFLAAWGNTDKVHEALHECRYNVHLTCEKLIVPVEEDNWTDEDKAKFEDAMYEFGKDFSRMKKKYLPKKSVKSLIQFYYNKFKLLPEYKLWRKERFENIIGAGIPDFHSNSCKECDKPGELLCCATCRLAYHPLCVPKPYRPPGLSSRTNSPPSPIEVNSFVVPTGSSGDDAELQLDWSCPQCAEDVRYQSSRKRGAAMSFVQEQIKEIERQREFAFQNFLKMRKRKREGLFGNTKDVNGQNCSPTTPLMSSIPFGKAGATQSPLMPKPAGFSLGLAASPFDCVSLDFFSKKERSAARKARGPALSTKEIEAVCNQDYGVDFSLTGLNGSKRSFGKVNGTRGKRSTWSSQETITLLTAIKEHGFGNWEKILSDPCCKKDLQNRSEKSLKTRLKTLASHIGSDNKDIFKNEAELLKAISIIQGQNSSSVNSGQQMMQSLPVLQNGREI